jgi:DNA primase
MSFGPAFDAKEQVRQAIDIVDLVGSYVQLRRQGRNFVGLCPWHDDSRPSLQVNPDRQSFKCWVCDYGGDVFSFVMRTENMEFREALELLAERAGISLQRSEPGGPPPREQDEKRTLYRAAAWAEEQFHRCLMESPDAQPGRTYLIERGLTEDTIRRYRIGFAPNRWDWLLERACGTEWSPATL